MSKKGLLAVPLLFSLLICAGGCVVNKAISASAVADNLTVEKAQNEMLLLNVLRGKDHRPMYVTGISKITGSIKAEASLNATVPFGSLGGSGSGGSGLVHYMASPAATYNWNPSFDVNVLDTSEFMHGFLAPVSSDVFAYYWNLGFYREVLFHLMVLRVQVTVKHKVCDGKKDRLVDEYVFYNNHEEGYTEPSEIERFAEWVDNFLKQNPHIVEGKIEPLGPRLSKKEAERALINGLQEGLTLTQVGQEFQFQRLAPPPARLKLDVGSDVLRDIDRFLVNGGKEGRENYQHSEPYLAEADPEGCQPQLADKTSSQPKAPPGTVQDSGLFREADGSMARMTITLFLRSPEAILYYLGELSRIEEDQGKTLYVCIGGKLEPLFVVQRRGDCRKSLVEVTNGDGVTYSIPVREGAAPVPCCDKISEMRDLTCNPGRSMEALTIVSQLISLQKSAKDLPTTSVVRVVGQ